MATDIAAAREPIAALVSQEQALLTSRVNKDLVQDLGTLLKNRQELMGYVAHLQDKPGDDKNNSLPRMPEISHIRFDLLDGRPNLMDAYATHTARETQPKGDDGSLTQLRDWGKIGVDDLTLVESLVAQHDPEPNKAGHDYQQLALDRHCLVNNRLRLAK